MTLKELAEKLALTELCAPEEPDTEVAGCYIGDLLSWVMGRAGAGSMWITVIGNVNAIAVATLADLSCIVLCEDAPLDAQAKAQAEIKGVPIYTSARTAYELAAEYAQIVNG